MMLFIAPLFCTISAFGNYYTMECRDCHGGALLTHDRDYFVIRHNNLSCLNDVATGTGMNIADIEAGIVWIGRHKLEVKIK